MWDSKHTYAQYAYGWEAGLIVEMSKVRRRYDRRAPWIEALLKLYCRKYWIWEGVTADIHGIKPRH